jgi:lipopolysaccharide export system ATP-binding protein
VKTRQEFLAFLTGLGPHDASLVLALQELLRRADASGGVERGVWVASVRQAFEELGTPAGSVSNPGDALGAYLREHVLARMEAAGVAEREPPDDEAWERLAVPVDLWSVLGAQREVYLGEVESTLRRFQAAKTAPVGAAPAPSAEAGASGNGVGVPFQEGSRLWARGLEKVYRRRRVVHDVDIQVRQGEIVGLLGPNGAGKTTTFYMIVGLIPPNRGTVGLDDRKLTDVPMYRRARMGVGYLAQEPSVFRKLTVEENVLAILETLKLSRKERARRLEELLDELSLTHLRKSRAYALSGGERRRLEITRALVQRPKFMLLDEPFAGIDPIAVNDIQQIVSGLRHRGIGVIISDHNVEQTLEIVDRAYIMYEGGIRLSGTVSELVWNDEAAEIYLGPTLTQRMRQRYPRPGELA